jgi:hypothetical protein
MVMHLLPLTLILNKYCIHFSNSLNTILSGIYIKDPDTSVIQ